MEMPIMVRLTVDHMKHEIVRAVSNYEVETDSAINNAVQAAIDQFDFDAAVRDSFNREMKSAIDSAVRSAVSDIARSGEFREAVAEKVKVML